MVLPRPERLRPIVVGLVVGAVYPDDLVLLERAVEVGVAELHRVEADPLGPAAIESDTGHAHGFAVGLARIWVGLDRDHHLRGFLTWPRSPWPDRSRVSLRVPISHPGRVITSVADSRQVARDGLCGTLAS